MPSYEIRIFRKLPQAAVVYVEASDPSEASIKAERSLANDMVHFYSDNDLPRNPEDTTITNVIELYSGGQSPHDILTAEYEAWTKGHGLSSTMCASELLHAIEQLFLVTNPSAKVWHAWLVDFIERWEHADVNF
jgi:hypothetical protein